MHFVINAKSPLILATDQSHHRQLDDAISGLAKVGDCES
jgi:hypothetical protein